MNTSRQRAVHVELRGWLMAGTRAEVHSEGAADPALLFKRSCAATL